MFRKNNNQIDTVAVLMLYLMFSILVIFTFMTGIKAYNSIRHKNDDNYSLRTSLQYVSNKTKAYQKKGAVAVDKLNGKDVLKIMENLDGKEFVTYIYENEGMLCELFIETGTKIDLSWGTKINNIEIFEIEKLSDKLVKIRTNDTVPLIIAIS